jgi:hypothetical protein
MKIGLAVGVLFALYVASWIPVAYLTGVLFPGQMLKKYPEPGRVIPLVLDFYLWADLLFFPIIVTCIVSETSAQWGLREVFLLFLAGMVAAWLFQQYVIMTGKYPSTLGGIGRTTIIGYLHMPFFAAVFAVMMMFLFTTVSTGTVLFVTGMFMLIIPINMLVPLHFIRQWLGLTWAPDVFGEEPRLFWMIGGSWIGTMILAALKLAVQRWMT